MKNSLKYIIAILITAIVAAGAYMIFRKPSIQTVAEHHSEAGSGKDYHNDSDKYFGNSSDVIKESGEMPVYGNWKTFTTKDGLPSDKAYAVRIDGDRVLVGTHDGLAVYE